MLSLASSCHRRTESSSSSSSSTSSLSTRCGKCSAVTRAMGIFLNERLAPSKQQLWLNERCERSLPRRRKATPTSSSAVCVGTFWAVNTTPCFCFPAPPNMQTITIPRFLNGDVRATDDAVPVIAAGALCDASAWSRCRRVQCRKLALGSAGPACGPAPGGLQTGPFSSRPNRRSLCAGSSFTVREGRALRWLEVAYNHSAGRRRSMHFNFYEGSLQQGFPYSDLRRLDFGVTGSECSTLQHAAAPMLHASDPLRSSAPPPCLVAPGSAAQPQPQAGPDRRDQELFTEVREAARDTSVLGE